MQSALKSLLNLMCEAVVEVDSAFVIVRHVPALSNLLLHGAGKSLQGMMLQQFMPSHDDKLCFEEAIQKATGSTAQVLHSKMRDHPFAAQGAAHFS